MIFRANGSWFVLKIKILLKNRMKNGPIYFPLCSPSVVAPKPPPKAITQPSKNRTLCDSFFARN